MDKYRPCPAMSVFVYLQNQLSSDIEITGLTGCRYNSNVYITKLMICLCDLSTNRGLSANGESHSQIKQRRYCTAGDKLTVISYNYKSEHSYYIYILPNVSIKNSNVSYKQTPRPRRTYVEAQPGKTPGSELKILPRHKEASTSITISQHVWL